MTRFIQERPRPISLQRRRCLDRSSEAIEGEVKALRAVAGSLSLVARQCRPDEVGSASTLQGSVSRAVMKDLSDSNRAVNRLKQTEDVGLLIQSIPLVNLRTVSISDAALDLDRFTQSETKCVCVSGWPSPSHPAPSPPLLPTPPHLSLSPHTQPHNHTQPPSSSCLTPPHTHPPLPTPPLSSLRERPQASCSTRFAFPFPFPFPPCPPLPSSHWARKFIHLCCVSQICSIR